MKLPCSVVRDLLPVYTEKLVEKADTSAKMEGCSYCSTLCVCCAFYLFFPCRQYESAALEGRTA